MALPTTIVNPTIFREYIGSKPYPPNLDDFPDIINPELKEFHFIIAFASEVYHGSGTGDEHRVGTGDFYRNWHVPLIDGEMIRMLKNKCDNAKVLISIGGRRSSGDRDSKYPFNPAEKEIWLHNATNSLTTIINDFKDSYGKNLIDGIDINYDTITSSVDVFANCIGELINSLKTNQLINVVSIAPSYSVDAYYKALYAAYENAIDWVNYQFYTHTQPIPTPNEFEGLYRQLACEDYPPHKLLAGFSTDPHDVRARILPRGVFIQACRDLIKKGVLPGIFIWNANDSAPRFLMEEFAQKLLIPQN